MEKPLVSIIMPAYNAGRFITEAIESVLKQSYQEWELIIIDDGSTDNTASLIQNYKNTRIKYIYQENKGVSKARNVGIANARGHFITFLDADDVFVPDSINEMVVFMQNKPNVSVLGFGILVKDEQLKKTIRVYVPSYSGNPVHEYVRLTGRCFFGIPGMIRRESEVSYVFPTEITHGEDLLFYISIFQKSQGVFDYIEKPLYVYRKSASSAMGNLDALAKGYQQIRDIINTMNGIRWTDRLIYCLRVYKIMILSYVKQGFYIKAAKYAITCRA